MFDALSEKFTSALNQLKGRGKLNEANIDNALKKVKHALLEADVNFKVVKAFLKSVKTRALGQEVQTSLSPGQQFIKIVNDELTALMGSENKELIKREGGPTIIMLVGLQGSGKTTTIGKLANHLTKNSFKTLLVPADIYRPAAIEQLKVLANSLNVACYNSQSSQSAQDIVKKALEEAKTIGAEYVLVDTAGRLHIDEPLMAELSELKTITNADEILFIADAMTGQDAVNMAKAFNDQLDITGVILTKMDGDARGGAALSIRAITQKPVKFITVGEKLDNLEVFHPDRMSSRILGMGDMLSLIEKAQDTIDEKESLELASKFKKNEFTLEDFQKQLQSMKKMGSVKDILGMLPGVNSKMIHNSGADDRQIIKTQAIIGSMTKKERNNHNIINGSRRLRIAKGSGTKVSDINKLLKQFVQMRKMMKKLSSAKNSRSAMQMMNEIMPS